MKKVLLVDDHDLIRQGLRHAFERADDFTVVGEASSVAEALAVATQTQPDVVLMDIRLPDGSGLDAVRKLRASNAQLGIVVLTNAFPTGSAGWPGCQLLRPGVAGHADVGLDGLLEQAI